MSVDQDTLNRAIAAARALEAQGYFEKVRQGDQRAASLFARLTAFRLNPNGNTSDYGCLSKSPGETGVDGFAEDAICFTADSNDRQNVVDLINGAGAPGASIGGAVKERRPNNVWVKPQALNSEQLAYLKSGGMPPDPTEPPIPPPSASFPYPDEPTAVLNFQKRVKAAYNSIGRIFPDPNDSDAYRHFSRYGYSCSKMPEPEAANKHIKELRQELGAPPE